MDWDMEALMALRAPAAVVLSASRHRLRDASAWHARNADYLRLACPAPPVDVAQDQRRKMMSGNAYFIYTAVLMVLFISVLFWAFGKQHKKRFEKDAEIPFQDKQ